MKMNTHILNTGFNNMGSLENMISFIGGDSTRLEGSINLNEIDRLIIPGIGKFDHAMKTLNKMRIRDFLNEFMNTGRPILGICLGMQIMTNISAEGKLDGLGWFNASTDRFIFKSGSQLSIPHMRWNKVVNAKSDLFKNLDENHRFYFVHSYHVNSPEEHRIGSTIYGYEFTSAIQNQNIFGVQFHPEKSQKHGLKLIENFLKL